MHKLTSLLNIIIGLKNWLLQTVSFMLLLTVYMLSHTLMRFSRTRFCPRPLTRSAQPLLSKIYFRTVDLTKHKEGTINRINLIELALHNMRFKATRTVITIGGMAVGISAIVFLVGIGYGLQELVISRVARLDELKQADIFIQPGSNLQLNDEILSNISEVTNVDKVLPLIALVGRVNFKGSVSDMAAYGVTTEYLEQSAIKPVKGGIFDSNEIAYHLDDPNSALDILGTVAGAKTALANFSIESGQLLNKDVEFSIIPGNWIRVHEKPTFDSKLLGYTRRMEGVQLGTEVLGDLYPDNENGKYIQGKNNVWYGKWLETKVYLWEKDFAHSGDGSDYTELKNAEGFWVQETGFIPEIGMDVGTNKVSIPAVLGDSDISLEDLLKLGDTETGESTSSAGIDSEVLLLLGDDLPTSEEEEITKVPFAQSAKKKAVVNRAMLKVLGIEENDAIGQLFDISFVVTSDLLEDTTTNRVESELAQYEIVGVIPQDDVPFFYVPFIDLRGLGIRNYSQLKVSVNDTQDLAGVRQNIESMGFVTNSVVDTVEQINSLFATARIVLALIGTVALAVAALGMFNTLTVSLLERTREIGLMKAMGMKSYEVKELFLTESMIMGIFGGMTGIIVGILAGKLLGLVLSVVAISQGVGYLDITYVPPTFILIILFLSTLVGTVTGIYPARRATKISALNALRYE